MRDTKERVIFAKSGDGRLPSRFSTQREQPGGELSSIVLTVTNNGSILW